MYWIFLISAMAIAYLSGSVSFAIIVSTLFGKNDIREVGTKNAGTANVGRILGKRWGAIVFIGDVAKGVIPLVIAENIYWKMDTFSGTAGLALMAMAAILGHRKPLFFGFRGGGGLATTMGVMAFFAPVETFLSMAIGYGLGSALFRNKDLKLGRWTAMLIILINPAVSLILSIFAGIPIAGRVSIGGLAWFNVAAVAVLAIYIVVSNLSGMAETIRNG